MVLDASDFGVPQNRKRAIIVGIRNDFANIKFDFNQLVKLPKVTVEDAIGELYGFETNTSEYIELTEKPDTPYRKYLRSHIFKNYWTLSKAISGKINHNSNW